MSREIKRNLLDRYPKVVHIFIFMCCTPVSLFIIAFFTVPSLLRLMTEQSSQFEPLPLTEHALGIQRRRGDESTPSEVSTSASSPGIHWDPKMEIALFHAVMKNKPVGTVRNYFWSIQVV